MRLPGAARFPAGYDHLNRARLALALVGLAVAGLPACGLSSARGAGTYRGHGVSFDYPGGWQKLHMPRTSYS